MVSDYNRKYCELSRLETWYYCVYFSEISISDVSESILSSQSHKPFESELSQGHLKFFRVRVMTWSCRVSVESQELLSRFESLVCKLESMSSHTKFRVFSTNFFCYEMAPNML